MLKRACGMSTRPLVYKISDMSAGVKPWDCFYMGSTLVASMFVVGMTCTRGYVGVYSVGIEKWCKMTCGKKSVNLDDLKAWGGVVPLGE